MKVLNSLASVDGVGREVAEFSLDQRMKAFHLEYNRKGGCGNAEIERLFSIDLLDVLTLKLLEFG